jgi:hypothetical protein
MPDTLQQILLAPAVEPQVADDCYELVEQEVADKSGVSGAAMRLAFKTVNTFRPGHVRYLITDMLPKIVARLEPFWADYCESGSSEFGDYLAKRGEEVADALLAVTDARAQASGRPTIVRAYRSVRPGAARHIEAALPRVGDLVLKYARLSRPCADSG